MREAAIRLQADGSNAFGIYLSLRYLPLLRESGSAYEKFFCDLLCDTIGAQLEEFEDSELSFPRVTHAGELQRALSSLAVQLDRRIVLLFDDAAHLGRENSSSEFFDIFRTISSRSVSCKAAIYPGVTNFGKRFDVFNDATVIDVARDESTFSMGDFFYTVMEARYPKLPGKFVSSVRASEVAAFLGKAVLGNMRAFVFACNRLDAVKSIGMPELTKCLIDLCAEYFWPLLEEVQPKLGRYEPLVEPSRNLASVIFTVCAESKAPSVIIYREFCQHFAKSLEILE